ncbi:MAG: hypothetical protein ACI9KE_003668 [Polyangiales bacterium]
MNKRDLGRAVLLAAWVGCIWFTSALCASGAAPSSVVLALLATFVPYGALLILREEVLSTRTLCLVVACAGLPALFVPSLLSDDVFRFLWDGHVSLAGVDPYAHAPSSPAVAGLRDVWWSRINHAEIPTVYPPVAQFVFALTSGIFHHPLSFKALALGVHVAIVYKLTSSASHRAALAYGLNPLALMESALGAHLDVLVGGAVLLFALNLRDARFARAAFACVVSVGLKLIGLLFLPLLLFRRPRVAAAALAVSLLLLVPVARAGYGDDEVSGLSHYAGRWEGNAGPYRWVDTAMRAGLEACFGVAPGRIDVEAFAAPFAWVRGSALDPWHAYEREKKPVGRRTIMATQVLSSFLTRGLLFLCLLFAAFWLARKKVDPLRVTRFLVFTALLCAPQVHPWYLLWLLPLEAQSARWSAFVWSAVVLVAYIPLDGWVQARLWVESSLAIQAEYILVLAALAFESFGTSRNRDDPKELAPSALVSSP